MGKRFTRRAILGGLASGATGLLFSDRIRKIEQSTLAAWRHSARRAIMGSVLVAFCAGM
jgi:hypothetical protein